MGIGTLVKYATVAGLLGLVILNANHFATLIGAASSTFRKAVTIA